MMRNAEAFARMVRERLADVPLPAEDWEALVPQIERLWAVVASLDDLPLDAVEPAAIYKIVP